MEFSGLRIAGRIDRIEVSRDRKFLRILDFKTSNTFRTPREAHCRVKNGNVEFSSLQLPLYALLLRKDPFFAWKFPELPLADMKIQCGYFNLPMAVSETQISIWEDMDTILEAAEGKVREVAEGLRLMQQGIFPEDPDKKVKYDAFEELFRSKPSLVLRGVSFRDPVSGTAESAGTGPAEEAEVKE
ncbi:MAG: PD-(D/E)XK nuclease family protein [Lentisphaeria bacterium]|nr:PD-(D/E)XK nuclease family protein [Lentisphaeria bacterium]